MDTSFFLILFFLAVIILLILYIIREKIKLRQDLVARRQKKILMWRDRQKYLEETASREAELVQELDRFLSVFFTSTYVIN